MDLIHQRHQQTNPAGLDSASFGSRGDVFPMDGFKVTAVGFEPTRIAPPELESGALDHSAKLSCPCTQDPSTLTLPMELLRFPIQHRSIDQGIFRQLPSTACKASRHRILGLRGTLRKRPDPGVSGFRQSKTWF